MPDEIPTQSIMDPMLTDGSQWIDWRSLDPELNHRPPEGGGFGSRLKARLLLGQEKKRTLRSPPKNSKLTSLHLRPSPIERTEVVA
jgi:hypothetical protein